jgi:hypothetical protein
VAFLFLLVNILLSSVLDRFHSKRQTHFIKQNRAEAKPVFNFDKRQAEAALAKHGVSRFRIPIAAFLEPPLNDLVEGSIHRGDPSNASDVGVPPLFVEPLPTRNHAPQDLKQVHYPKFQTCHDLPSKLPVDRGLVLDNITQKPIIWNTITEPTPDYYNDVRHCPVDGDPHLPWIHDIVPARDGSIIHFVAQNKRRCHTGQAFLDSVQKLAPQVSLFQPVSVQRLSSREAKQLAPQLYHGGEEFANEVRYRLADYSKADPDAQQTRFRCLFTATNITTATPSTFRVGETLSIYPFNSEYVSWRRSSPTMINPRGTDRGNLLVATLLFACPVPPELQSLVASGQSVLSDGTPTLHIDLIPIRTSPRYGLDEVYFTETMAGPKDTWHLGNFTRLLWRERDDPIKGFDAEKRWGSAHVLPLAVASGRWANLPICSPHQFVDAIEIGKGGTSSVVADLETKRGEQNEIFGRSPHSTKPFFLTACTWASAFYSTRGRNVAATNSSIERLSEWLEFALLVGFDHIYVYDNSAANHPTVNLKPVTDRFPQVTRVEWNHVVCNNNHPNGLNPGERSSQYAAENSCRVRFGNSTEWMASFDVDEFLVPMGSYTSLKQVLRDLPTNVNIVDFRSSRTKLRLDATEPTSGQRSAPHCKISGIPFLQAYNCDTELPPKPFSCDRARKEIYRTSHILLHFVHYSLVTKTVAAWYDPNNPDWTRYDSELLAPEHQTDEVKEAIMLHSKSANEGTHSWKQECKSPKRSGQCVIGIPWPRESWNDSSVKTADGYLYNCHENARILDYWIPKLKQAMADRAEH